MTGTPRSAIPLASEAETAGFAARLAPLLGPGDAILLEGPVGAGKTALARALIGTRLAAAGRAEDVPSPSYTLVQTYDDGACEIWHVDLYRLTAPGQVLELGLDEAFESAIALIEWPDRLGAYAPPDALTLTLAPGASETARLLTVSAAAASPWWQRLAGFVPAPGAAALHEG